MTPWELKARELVNCTCEYGCNCQFNALPDKGHCHAVGGMIVDEGHYGDVRLDGLKAAFAFKWPGPIHEGHGEAMVVIDQSATPAQREALLKIMAGEDTAPMATMFAVFASTLETMHEPVFADIDIAVDVDARQGHVRVKDLIDVKGQPIRNAVTGQETRAQIVLPDGFEYEVADIGSASSRTSGPVKVDIDEKYAQFANIHLNNDGVVRSRIAA